MKTSLPLDVTDPSDVQRALEAAVARFGGLDVAVNNASPADFGAVEDTSLASLI